MPPIPSQALIKIKEQQDNPPSAAQFRIPMSLPALYKTNKNNTRWNMISLDIALYLAVIIIVPI